jgi:hypothetical protein
MLAAVYRDRGGGLWLRYDPANMLDPVTGEMLPSPRPGGRAVAGLAYAPLLAQPGDESWLRMRCDQCTRQWPMEASGAELLTAAETARTAKACTVIAKPTVIPRLRDTPPG